MLLSKPISPQVNPPCCQNLPLNWTGTQSRNRQKIQNSPDCLKISTTHPKDSGKRIAFQQYITERRAQIVQELPQDRNYLIERSLYSDLIFTQANFISMEQPDERYMLHYCDIQRRLNDYPVISAVVYLSTSPETAHERLLSRARSAEDGTSLNYIRDIHNYHEAILPQVCRSMNTPLITVEGDDFGCEKQVAEMIRQTINC